MTTTLNLPAIALGSFLAFCLATPWGAAAQAPPKPVEGVEVEERIVVTAPPIIEESRYQPLAGVVVEVGARQIEDLAAQDLASALRRVPGVVISRYNPVGSYGGGDGGGLFVRGVGSGRPGAELATRVDGVPKFVGVWTHPLLDLIGIDAAERVDVYKGPQPVLFGTMAFATVDLVPMRRLIDGYDARVSAAAGSFGTTALSLRHSGRAGRLDYAVAGGTRRSDGHRDGADGRTQALYGRFGWDLGGGWSVATTFDLASGRAGDPGVAGAPVLPVQPRFESDDLLGVVTLARHREDDSRSGFLKAWLDDGSIDWRQWDASRADGFSTLTAWRNFGVKAQERLSLGERGGLTLGAEIERFGGVSREERPHGTVPLGEFRFGNSAVYAGYSHTMGQEVPVTPSIGVRYNQSRDFGGEWGGQLGLQVAGRLGEAWVRGARAYNLPGVWVAMLYRGYGRGQEYRELGPELLDHFELGVARSFGDVARVELSVFHSEVRDALRLIPPPPPPPRWDNVGTYTARGAELTVSARPVPTLALFLGLTAMTTEPEAVPFTPDWTASAGATWTRGPWRLSMDLQHLSERKVGNLRFPGAPPRLDAFTLVNGRLAHRFPAGLELFVAGENLGDSSYAYRPGYPMPGRNWLSGVAWSF